MLHLEQEAGSWLTPG